MWSCWSWTWSFLPPARLDREGDTGEMIAALPSLLVATVFCPYKSVKLSEQAGTELDHDSFPPHALAWGGVRAADGGVIGDSKCVDRARPLRPSATSPASLGRKCSEAVNPGRGGVEQRIAPRPAAPRQSRAPPSDDPPRPGPPP